MNFKVGSSVIIKNEYYPDIIDRIENQTNKKGINIPLPCYAQIIGYGGMNEYLIEIIDRNRIPIVVSCLEKHIELDNGKIVEAENMEDEELSDTQTLIVLTLDNLKEFLLEKNRRYGNSALEPIRVASKLDSNEQIKIRIDDKLNRIKNSEVDRENDWLDLAGYIVLLMVKNNWNDFKKYLD